MTLALALSCPLLCSHAGTSPLLFHGLTPCQDETLKQSFLTAVLMLARAISRNEGAHSYEFSQTSELLESLMVSAWSRSRGRGFLGTEGVPSLDQRGS